MRAEWFVSQWLWFVVVMVLSSSVVAGIGYAPITIHGVVNDEGVPLEGASVTLRLIENGEVVLVTPEEVTNEEGMFVSVVTVPDPSVVQLEVVMVKEGVSFVELLDNVSSWGSYWLTFSLGDEQLVRDLHNLSGARPFFSDDDDPLSQIRSGIASGDMSWFAEAGVAVVSIPHPSAPSREDVLGGGQDGGLPVGEGMALPPVEEHPMSIGSDEGVDKNAICQKGFFFEDRWVSFILVIILTIIVVAIRLEVLHSRKNN